ncbi:hypothetical protein GQR58_002500 [Nymphon striatum]|nr:hypothetical protein GQR58_002500 [Nymphon striatum]
MSDRCLRNIWNESTLFLFQRDVRHAVTFTKMVEASIDSSDEDIFLNYAGKNGIKPYRFEPKRRRLNVDQHDYITSYYSHSQSKAVFYKVLSKEEDRVRTSKIFLNSLDYILLVNDVGHLPAPSSNSFVITLNTLAADKNDRIVTNTKINKSHHGVMNWSQRHYNTQEPFRITHCRRGWECLAKCNIPPSRLPDRPIIE